mmetsp:Transcript_16512/g.11859  ORF Transcript_16512/g.11859 Transcript_16512/m.11859 type:complete len:81 (+) Transcript_16512:283-525(+)
MDESANDIKIYVADCNNHCIRKVLYDVGDISTVELKGVPSFGVASENDLEETDGTTTNKSGVEEEMALECDGNNCYPKFF